MRNVTKKNSPFLLLLAGLLSLFPWDAAAAQADVYPRFSQTYLSSPENSFLLTGLCEQYSWEFPHRGQVREYRVESQHLGNVVGFRFDDGGRLTSCYSYDSELVFSYRNGRLERVIQYKINNNVLEAGIESEYRYFPDKPDRVEVWSMTGAGQKVHTSTYLLDGFELTIRNERMNSETVQVYDHLGRLVERRTPYARTVFDYNEDGYIVLESRGQGAQPPSRSKIISYVLAADGNIELMQTKALSLEYRNDYLFSFSK